MYIWGLDISHKFRYKDSGLVFTLLARLVYPVSVWTQRVFCNKISDFWCEFLYTNFASLYYCNLMLETFHVSNLYTTGSNWAKIFKYKMLVTLGCKDIEIQKSEFVEQIWRFSDSSRSFQTLWPSGKTLKATFLDLFTSKNCSIFKNYF